MNHILKLGTLIFLLCILVPKSAKPQSDEKCYSIVDTFSFPLIAITDSTFATMLDSAISMVKIKPVHGYTIPYLMILRAGEAKGRQRFVELIAQNKYGIAEAGGKEAWYDPYRICMLLQRGKYQILVDTSEFETSWFSEYLKPVHTTGQYYAYGFYMNKGKDGTCDFIPGITQEVIFELWPGRTKRRFTFEKYILSVTNLFYDDDGENTCQPPKKKR